MPQQKQPKKQPAPSLSLEEQVQIEQLLTRQEAIAHTLRKSSNQTSHEEAITPITALTETMQLGFLKALGKTPTTDAADIAAALNIYSTVKNVRKEARRTLIKFEASRIYPDWTPQRSTAPFVPTTAPFMHSDQGDLPLPSSSGIQPAFQNFVQSLLGADPAALEIVSQFLDNWSQSLYEDAYDLLSTGNSLREGLSRDAWAEQRRLWSSVAQPHNLAVAFMTPDQPEKEEPEEDELENETDESEPIVVQVGWSLCCNKATAENIPQELPTATAYYPETGRHWFWSRFTVAPEGDEWRIAQVEDNGGAILQLPEEEFQIRLNAIAQLADEQLKQLEEEAEEIEKQNLLDKEGEDKEDREDFNDLEFADLMGRFDEAIQVITKAMHYYDAAIQRVPNNPANYDNAFTHAGSIQDFERAATYAQLISERFPEGQGEALRKLALAQMSISNQFTEEEDEEESAHFANLAEQTVRQAIALDKTPLALVMLAQMLMDKSDDVLVQGKYVAEIKQLLQDAQTYPIAESERPTLLSALGRQALLLNDAPGALKHFQHLEKLQPDYPNIWFTIGAIQHNLNRDKEAKASFHRSIEVEPDNINAYVELAAIYMKEEDVTAVREVAEEGLEFNPDSAELLAILSITYSVEGDLTSARELLEEAEEIDEESEVVVTARTTFEMRQNELKRSKPQQKYKKPKPKKKR